MLTEEQKKAKAEYKKNKKIKKWHRRARCRFLKNLLIWFVGFISSLAIVGGGAYIAIGVIPLNNFVGNDETYVSNKVASETVLSLFQNLNGYKVSDFPVLEDALLSLTTGLGVDGLVSIDTEKISSLSIGSITSGEGIDALLSAVNVEATFKDVVDMTGFSLGSLTNLDVFTKYEIVTEKPSSEEYGSPDFNHNKYYYEKEPGVYAPAFVNNDYAPGVDSNTDLYYPPLNEVGVLDLFDIFDSALNRLKVSELINTFMGGEDESSDTSVTSLLTKIFGDTTVGNIGEFDYTTIALNNLLPAEENPALYDILKDISKESDATLITIAHLTGIDESTINSIRLCSIIKTEDENGNPTNQDVWEIIEGLTGERAENITIETLMNSFTQEGINGVKLSTFVEFERNEDGEITANKDLWDLLEGLTGERAENITLTTLTNSFTQEKINNINLSTFIEFEKDVDGNITKNKDLWELLEGITGTNADEITLTTLTNSFTQEKLNEVKLSLFIEYEEDGDGNITKNKDIWELLKGITKEDNVNNITLNSLSSITEEKIKGISLSSLLDPNSSENADFYDLLKKLTNKTNVEDITIGVLTDIDPQEVAISAFLGSYEENKAIYDLLKGITGEEDINNIYVKDLSVDLDTVDVSALLGEESENPDVYKLLRNLTGKKEGEPITVADIKKLDQNNITLESVLPRKENGEDVNKEIWDILDAVVKPKDSSVGITIGDLGSGFNLDNLPLSKVIEEGSLWDILSQAVTATDVSVGITVGDLKKGFVINNVTLESVLPKKENGEDVNKEIWDILDAVVKPKDSSVGITVGDLGSGFNLDNLPLSKVVEEGSLWDILSQAVTATDVSVGITVGDLKKGFVINNVTLESVLPKQDNTAIWDILETVVTYDKQVGITIGNLSSFNLDNLPLSKVIDEGTTLWNILKEATFDPENPTKVITVGVLKTGFSINNVKLESVLPKKNSLNEPINQELWNILEKVVTYDTSIGLTIGNLSSFNLEKLPLADAVPNDGKLLWQILEQAVTPADNTVGITIKDLKSGFSVDNVKLETVLPNNSTNSAIWNILSEAVTASGTDGKIRIKDLGSGFNMENVSLSTVYPDDGSTLWTILKEAITPKDTAKGITIYDLKNNFKVDNIHLSSVIKETNGNQVLEALLLEEDATLGNIATKLNELKLKEMYNINCFTKNVSEAAAGSPKYSLSKLEDATGNHDHFTLNENGEYYIKKDAGVWLLLLYKADEKDSNGDALTYTCKCLTLGSLTNTIASAADCFMNATIKMLVDSGILVESVPNQYSSIYAFSVKNVFDTAAFGLSQ